MRKPGARKPPRGKPHCVVIGSSVESIRHGPCVDGHRPQETCDRDPDASYGVWDTAAATFEFRRVPYDRAAAQRAILEAGLPARFAQRLDFGY